MSDDQFTKLFKYMSRRFDDIEAALATKADRSATDRIYNLLDSVAKQQEIDTHERLALTSQIDRHERWISQVAEKINTDLTHD